MFRYRVEDAANGKCKNQIRLSVEPIDLVTCPWLDCRLSWKSELHARECTVSSLSLSFSFFLSLWASLARVPKQSRHISGHLQKVLQKIACNHLRFGSSPVRQMKTPTRDASRGRGGGCIKEPTSQVVGSLVVCTAPITMKPLNQYNNNRHRYRTCWSNDRIVMSD